MWVECRPERGEQGRKGFEGRRGEREDRELGKEGRSRVWEEGGGARLEEPLNGSTRGTGGELILRAGAERFTPGDSRAWR